MVYALTESDGMQNYITIPYISGENGEFCTDISSHRIWKREFSEKTSNLDCALRFRIAPDTWPNIKIKEADMSPDDIFAHAYEAIFDIETKGLFVHYLSHKTEYLLSKMEPVTKRGY